jgi:hypothetical protein
MPSVPTVSGPRLLPRRPPYPPPTISAASATASCGYKRSTSLMSSPFSPSSSAHAPPLLLLTPCQCRPLHLCPSSATPFGHPSARLSPPRAPPRASAPLRPIQLRPRPPLRPLTAAPPRSTRATVYSLIREPPTSPSPSIRFLLPRRRAAPASPPVLGFRLTGIVRRRRPLATAPLPCFRPRAERLGGPKSLLGRNGTCHCGARLNSGAFQFLFDLF